MTRVQMSLVTVCVLTVSGLLAACQVATVQPDAELQITSESAVANEVLEIAPAGITITELMEFDDYVRITGRAQANSEISEFMRAIDQSSLGAPSLGLITMENERSEFMLDIHRR